MDGRLVPSRDEMVGHWYLVATAERFLDRGPRLDAAELIARPADDDRIRFDGEFTTPHRRYRFKTDTHEPRSDGRFNWTAMRGMSIFTKSWILTISRDSSVLAAYHTGSLVIQQGFALFCRADVSREHAAYTIGTSGRELGMLPRQQDGLSFRPRPAAMDESGASELSDDVHSATPMPRFAVRGLVRPSTPR
jgi:hypothetical protein